ncbi:MAG: hypothetical protein AAFO94_15670, partial [Bacteroidota bacterium]
KCSVKLLSYCCLVSFDKCFIVEVEIKVFMDDLQNAIRNFAPDQYQPSSDEAFVERHQTTIAQ